MNKIKNTNKGITLIALIITIIVMLILVSVTITMAVNGGLFNYAQKAVGETKNAIDKEQELANGGLNIAGTWYNSIDEYLGTETITETHNWTRSGDTFTCSHCSEEYTMGEVVNYTPAGKTSTTITAAMSGIDKFYVKNSYYPNVNVDTTTGTQTIEAQDATWIVLGMEDTNGNGTNETLLITTQEPVTVNSAGKYLAFYGAESYNNGPEEIDRICEELYSNSNYGQARGMKIEDVNMVLGYTPTTAYYYGGSNYVATGNLTTKLKDLGEFFGEMVDNGTKTPDGKNTEAALGEYELNAYSYSLKGTNYLTLKDYYGGTDIKTITETERNTIFGASRDYSYWLANRGVGAETYGGTSARFGPGRVVFDLATSCIYMFHSSGYETDFSDCLRPVVSLISKLPTVK